MKSAAAVLICVVCVPGRAVAHADDLGYLINITVRPGYQFADAQSALSYGHSICDKVNSGYRYTQIVREVQSDFHTEDDFHASYLIGQAVDELCPASIWQLRQSAASYRPEEPR